MADAPPPTPAAPAPTPAPNLAGESRSTTYGGPATGGDKNWMFDFHGYVRAPLRLGMGDRSNPAAGQGGTTYHRPIVPDDQYLSWQYTGRGSDWAELFFSVGNPIISGTVGITGYQFTDAAWVNTDAQFGIALGYLTIRPDLPYKNVRTEFVVGSHWNRYGQAGKYDSGKYDTFVFGRTHVIGYKARGEIDISDVTLWAEQGFGPSSEPEHLQHRAVHAVEPLPWRREVRSGELRTALPALVRGRRGPPGRYRRLL